MVVFEKAVAKYIKFTVTQGHGEGNYYHLLTTWTPVFGGHDLGEIQPEDITRAADQLTKERKWTQTTRTCAVNVLSGLFSWAEKMGMVERNPARLVPRKSGRKLHNEGRFVLSRHQLQKLLKILELTTPLRDLVIFAAKTGVRLSAMTGLKVEDLMRDESGTWFVEIINKNDDPHRAYLYGQALEVAKRNRKRSAKMGSEYLFSGERGGKIRKKYIQNYLPSACRMAGIPYGRGKHSFTFHGLRRAFASHALNNGMSIDEVMSIGGWRSFTVVQRYAILSSDSRKKSFKKMDDLL